MSMRQYQPIWERLKVHKVAALEAHPQLHKRIIKAVIKEKYMDITYKLLLAEAAQKAIISYSIEDRIITFKLHISIGLTDL